MLACLAKNTLCTSGTKIRTWLLVKYMEKNHVIAAPGGGLQYEKDGDARRLA